MDIVEPIFFCAKLHPRRPAMMWIGGGVSYAHLTQTILAVARRLRDAGVTRSDIAAIDIKTAYHHSVVMLALMHLGVASASVDANTRDVAEAAGVSVTIADQAVPRGRARHIAIAESWFEANENAKPLDDTGFNNDESLFAIKFTSGTTGRPLAMRVNFGETWLWLHENRFFNMTGRTLSMFGLSSGIGSHALLTTLSRGGTFCLAGTSQEAFDTIQLCGVETLLASTMQLRRIAERAREANEPLHSVKTALVGGASVSTSLVQLAQRYVCSDLHVHYASAQAGFVAIAPAAMLEGRPGATGFVMPDVEIESVDENGALLPRGEMGELRIRTERTKARQTLSENAQALGFREGWFYPGDIGRVDADGMLILAGRKSEIVNIGGEKIAPDLVDEVLAGQPGVRDAAAFGIRNAQGDEDLWAAIVTDAPPDIPALIAVCRQALGAGAPSVILRAQAIPRNAAGKILRAQLSREIEEMARKSR